MSRIDEALRRAKLETTIGTTDDDGAEQPASLGDRAGQAAIPSADLFEAPWQSAPGAPPESAPREATLIAPRATQGPAPIAAASNVFGAALRPDRPEAPTRGTDKIPLASRPAVTASETVEADTRWPTPPTVREGPGQMALFKGFDQGIAERLVVSPHARLGMVEEYRKLAGTLHHAQFERNIHTVMISSAVPGEGKTLTAVNLSLTLSESYRRHVLLIDADLRQPRLHEIFQVPSLTGLSSGLKAETDEKLSIIQITATLSLLTAGRPDPDPMGGLSSTRMRRIVEEAAAGFDWVIIDTPPIGLLTDAHLLGTMVDTTLLVIRAAATPYLLVRKAMDAIGRERILGVVLNRAEEGVHLRHYGDYYGYYDGEGHKRRKESERD